MLLLCPLAVSRLASGAAVDRRENNKHTTVFNLLDTTRSQKRVEEAERTSTPTVTYSQEEEDEDYYDYELDDEMSGDYDTHMPRGKEELPCCFSLGSAAEGNCSLLV